MTWRSCSAALRSQGRVADSPFYAVLVRTLGLIFVVYFGAVIWLGWSTLGAVLSRIGLSLVLCASMLSFISYLIRFFRWHLCLLWMGEKVGLLDNLGIYLSGLVFSSSPGKVGETFRCFLLLRHSVAVPKGLAAFLADRLGDLLGVCALGVVAEFAQRGAFGPTSALLLAIAVASFLVKRFVNIQGAGGSVCRGLRLPFANVWAEALRCWMSLWSGWVPACCSALAAVAYGMQALVFILICSRVGVDVGLAQALGVYVFATFFGAASMVPGGLGVTEGVLAVQLVWLGVPSELAVAIALVARLLTFGFGMLTGALALLCVGAGRSSVEGYGRG